MMRWALVGVMAWALGASAGCDAGGDGGAVVAADGAGGGDAAATADGAATGDSAATLDAGPDAGPAADTSGGTDAGPTSQSYAACFPEIAGLFELPQDVLDAAEIGAHCAGTNHQEITGVEKIVFLGDSISAGSGASGTGYYRALLVDQLEAVWGPLEVANCSVGGAVNANLLGSQIPECFPGAEPLKTLTVFTSGGNDIVSLAFNKMDTAPAKKEVDTIAGQLRGAVEALLDPARFPNGSYVAFANVYEFTDGTGVLDACPIGGFVGLSGTWTNGVEVFAYLAEQYARVAVDLGADMVFMAEHFCGHGLNNSDPSSPCLAVAGDVWFANDCIHPNNKGHAALADLFFETITK